MVGAALFFAFSRAFVTAFAISNASRGAFADFSTRTSLFRHNAATAVGIGLALDDVSVRAVDRAEFAGVGAVVDASAFRASVGRGAVSSIDPFTAAFGVFATFLSLVGAALFLAFGRAFVAALAISDGCGGAFADFSTDAGLFRHNAAAAVGIGFALGDVVVGTVDRAKFAGVVTSVDTGPFGAGVGWGAIVDVDPFAASRGVFAAFLGHIGIALFFAFGGAFVAALAISNACGGVFTDLSA